MGPGTASPRPVFLPGPPAFRVPATLDPCFTLRASPAASPAASPSAMLPVVKRVAEILGALCLAVSVAVVVAALLYGAYACLISPSCP